jgi:hypothetical protein
MAERLIKATDSHTGESAEGTVRRVRAWEKKMQECFNGKCDFTEVHAGFKVEWTPNFEKEYAESEDAKTMNMMDYGIKRLGQVAKQKKRGLITMHEYKLYRDEIEKQLFRF